MGSVSLKIGDGTARFSRVTVWTSAVNVVMILSVITTNLFALYAFTYRSRELIPAPENSEMSLISNHISQIMEEIESSQRKLSKMERELFGYETVDISRPNTAAELKLFLSRHELPLGRDSKSGITEMLASVGHSCAKDPDMLSQFMSYKAGANCPDDWSLGQKLILKGCEPLPRRRCFAKTVPKVGLASFPNSLWKSISSSSMTWSGIGCKNTECLSKKRLSRDCNGCFNLTSAYESQKFVKSRGKNDFLIDHVLSLGSGGIRIGFDIGGGSGTFAARMAERNVTVISNTLNVDAPFSEFVAGRGLFPLHTSLDHRFPFFDNVFDLVRASSLDDGEMPEKLEFIMFDVDRILRAGGVLWLDNFHCVSDQKKQRLTELIQRFGYKKLKWVVGEKIDPPGTGKPEIFLSAVLQKPVRA